jgi:tRNA uridine 5-carboxymethylaminomethyl modification enzyme
VRRARGDHRHVPQRSDSHRARAAPAGRHGEPPSRELAESIKSFGFESGRLKTGTPPRLHRKSIDFDGAVAAGLFSAEDGDAVPVPFSFSTRTPPRNQIRCWLLHTNERVRGLVRSNIDRSPLYNGQIQGIGPRYCPSLEDKIMRFPDRERHQIYLEPEGLDVDEIYVNGFSMSLPRDVQEQLCSARCPVLETASIAPSWVRRRIRLRPADRAEIDAGNSSRERSLSRRSDQRDLGLRRGRGARDRSRHQRGDACSAASRRSRSAATKPTSASRGSTLITRGCLEPYRMFTSRAGASAYCCESTTPTCD